MIGLLFWKAHSATSTICFFVGIMVVVLLGMRSINKKFIGTYMLAALVLIVVAELVFGISAHLSEALGRGSELSGRTKIWAAVRILTPILLVFYIIAMDYPRIRALKPQSSSAFAGVEKTKQLAYAEEEYR